MVARVVSVPPFLVVAVATKITLPIEKAPTRATRTASMVSSSVTPWSFFIMFCLPSFLPGVPLAGRRTPIPGLDGAASGNGHGVHQAVGVDYIDRQAAARERAARVVHRQSTRVEIELKSARAGRRVCGHGRGVGADARWEAVGNCVSLRNVL